MVLVGVGVFREQTRETSELQVLMQNKAETSNFTKHFGPTEGLYKALI